MIFLFSASLILLFAFARSELGEFNSSSSTPTTPEDPLTVASNDAIAKKSNYFMWNVAGNGTIGDNMAEDWAANGFSHDRSVDDVMFNKPTYARVFNDPINGQTIYVVDSKNSFIKVIRDGIVTDYVGRRNSNGEPLYGYQGDGNALESRISWPFSIDIDKHGNLYIADTFNDIILKVTRSDNRLARIVGDLGQGPGTDNVDALATSLNNPSAVLVDAQLNLYILDSENNKVRYVDASTNIITTLVGTGVAGISGNDGPALLAQLNKPKGFAMDSEGNLFIADTGNSKIRLYNSSSKLLSTLFTPANALRDPMSITLNQVNGDVFIADSGKHNIYLIPDFGRGVLQTIAGNSSRGYSYHSNKDSATSLMLDSPSGVHFDPLSGNIYIADTNNNRIRALSVNNGPRSASMPVPLYRTTAAIVGFVVGGLFLSAFLSLYGSPGSKERRIKLNIGYNNLVRQYLFDKRAYYLTDKVDESDAEQLNESAPPHEFVEALKSRLANFNIQFVNCIEWSNLSSPVDIGFGATAQVVTCLISDKNVAEKLGIDLDPINGTQKVAVKMFMNVGNVKNIIYNELLHHLQLQQTLESDIKNSNLYSEYKNIASLLEKKRVITKVLGFVYGDLSQSFNQYTKLLQKSNNTNVYGIVMKYEKYGTLSKLMEDDRNQRRMKLVDKYRLIASLAMSVASIHNAGFVISDLKPDNIFVHDSDATKLIVGDFGQAAKRQNNGVTTTLEEPKSDLAMKIRGTLLYSSPQLLLRYEPSKSTDTYALGIIIWELLSGKSAIEGFGWADYEKNGGEEAYESFKNEIIMKDRRPDINDINAAVHKSAIDLILRCWSYFHKDRPSAPEIFQVFHKLYVKNCTKRFDIFLSHMYQEKRIVKYILQRLTYHGYRVWYDENDLEYDLYDSMKLGIQNSDIFMTCLHRDYFSRNNCKFEYFHALTHHKPMVHLITSSDFNTWSQKMIELEGPPPLQEIFDKMKEYGSLYWKDIDFNKDIREISLSKISNFHTNRYVDIHRIYEQKSWYPYSGVLGLLKYFAHRFIDFWSILEHDESPPQELIEELNKKIDHELVNTLLISIPNV